MAKIFIIDDEASVCKLLGRMVEIKGHTASYRQNLREGLAEINATRYDVVFLDVQLPDGSGLDIIPRIRASVNSPEVIIMTGFGDPDGAELAIKNGALDYIQKPVTAANIDLPLRRALRFRENMTPDRRLSVALRRESIVGNSPPMRHCFDLLAQAAAGDTNVPIVGETGTGKELFARALHENSPRSGGAFVVVDCTVLPGHLVESELFGHKKGAFTGADRDKDGLIMKADGGTLFLDEVGELSLPVQKAFLRVLQERRFRPVGSNQEVESDFRLVSATNRDLDLLVRSGRFREDLLFRIRAMNITLPPLRARGDDIREISLHYMSRFCERNRVGVKGFSGGFLDALEKYDWPGNVRELINTLETAFWTAGIGDTLCVAHLPMSIRIQLARASVAVEHGRRTATVPEPGPLTLPSFREHMEAGEKGYLEALLAATGGDMKACCRTSGISRSRLYALFKKHGLSRN